MMENNMMEEKEEGELLEELEDIGENPPKHDSISKEHLSLLKDELSKQQLLSLQAENQNLKVELLKMQLQNFYNLNNKETIDLKTGEIKNAQ